MVMEHRDGTGGMFCDSKSLETAKRDPLFYINPADTSCVLLVDASPVQLNLTLVLRYGNDKKFEFRREQLEQRRFEIYTAVDALKKLSVNGERGDLSAIDGSEVDWSDFHGKIRFSALQLAGHSFGATTLFSLLSHQSTEGFAPLPPVTHALFLDPWLDPFEKPSPVQARRSAQVKKVVLHSEGLTLWKDHMVQMVEIAKDWGNMPIYTIGTVYSVFIYFRSTFSPPRHLARTIHYSFSDYAVILPRFLIGKEVKLLRKISELSVAFLDDRLEDALTNSVTRGMEVETIKGRHGKERRQLVANAGDVIVH